MQDADLPTGSDAELDTAVELVGGFPRHATRDLIEARQTAHRRRLPLAGLLVAVGVTLLALGLPTERLLGPGPGLVDALADGRLASTRAIYLPLAQLLDALPGMSAERAAFLLSGLCVGAIALAIWQLGARRHATPHARLLVIALCLSAPVVFIAGTTPGPEALGALGAVIAFLALDRPGGMPGRATLAGFGLWLAVCAAPLYLWCLPAAAWALARGRGRVRGPLGALLWTCGLLVAWLGTAAAFRHLDGWDLWSWRDLALELARDLQAGAGGPTDARWLWFSAPALGGALLGLAGLASGAGTGGRTPAWVLAWLVLPALGLGLTGRVDWELPWLWALGPLALGIFRLFASRPGPSGRATTLALIGVSAVSVVGTRLWLRAGDPDAAWRAVAERELERGDMLLTTSGRRGYLGRHRFGLRGIELQETARLTPGYRTEVAAGLSRTLVAAQANGARIVLDRRLGADEIELVALLAELELRVSVTRLGYPARDDPGEPRED